MVNLLWVDLLNPGNAKTRRTVEKHPFLEIKGLLENDVK